MREIPLHLWNVAAAQRILGHACAGLEPAQQTATQADMSEYFVTVWCVHPDLIPQEMTVAVPEPEALFVVEPPLYLRRHELIDSELLALRYLVRIRIMEGHDWRTPSSTSDDMPAGDSNDSNDPN